MHDEFGMQKLDRSHIPEGYFQYRSHSWAFFAWATHRMSVGKYSQIIKEDGFFGYVTHFFGWLFSVAYFRKCDVNPTREMLAQYGMKRGLIFWSGWTWKEPKSPGWLRLGYVFSRSHHHSTRTSFTIIDRPDYWEKWTPRARRTHKKIQKNIADGIIRIDSTPDPKSFIDIYKKTKVAPCPKQYFIARQRYLGTHFSENIRLFLAYVGDKPLGGWAFLDDGKTSTYLFWFQAKEGKPYSLGLAVIDAWLKDSYQKGIVFADYDHMWNVLDPDMYKGYTEFKSTIADYELRFPHVWVKWIGGKKK